MADQPVPTRATDVTGEPVSLGSFKGFEVYPMPMFATIAVDDVIAVSRWYQAALGFGEMFAAPGPGGAPSLAHLRRRKYQDVLIVPGGAPAGAASTAPLTLSFLLDEDAALFAERARAVAPVGASAVTGPIDTPWNTTDVRVTDPAGNRLVFTGARVNPDPEHAARWKAMFDAAR
jgi:uncharacterized glyoxalase superfamily protein PhnB